MLRATLKGLFAHKARLALTALAIVFGVGFVAGTFIFTDTIDATFSNLFDDVFEVTHLEIGPRLVVAPSRSRPLVLGRNRRKEVFRVCRVGDDRKTGRAGCSHCDRQHRIFSF